MLPQSVKEGQSFIMQIMYFYCLIGTINFLCLAVLSQRVRGLFFGYNFTTSIKEFKLFKELVESRLLYNN